MRPLNVIYVTCFADPWLKVASVLQKEHGFKPVYWIGYEDDHSASLVPEAFPDCLYHDYYEAWKGIFPAPIRERSREEHLDIDFIKEYSSFELQAIKMMDRMDPDRFSFNFSERQRHYRNMVKLCSACLNHARADAVICDWIPHRLFDYVLYLLCRLRGIKIVYLGHTEFPGRILPLTELASVSGQIRADYETLLASGKDAGSLKAELPADVSQTYVKVQQFHDGAPSDHDLQLQLKSKESSGLLPLAGKFIKDMTGKYRDRYFGLDGFLRKGIPTYLKEKSKTIEESHLGLVNYAFNKLRANRYKTRLKNYYESRALQPEFDASYTYFALHYQPEMTTSPSGDIFVDQSLCLDVLHKHLPADHLIYIKEHPAVFHSHLEGHTSRAKYFYDDLLSYSRVRLIPSDYPSAGLIRNARAVATVTGTIGWEAMVLGKPVIAFGLKWYEKYDGVLKITSEESAAKICEFLAEFRFDERKLFAYLHALARNSSLVYPHRGAKEKVNVSEADCVERLVRLVVDALTSGRPGDPPARKLQPTA